MASVSILFRRPAHGARFFCQSGPCRNGLKAIVFILIVVSSSDDGSVYNVSLFNYIYPSYLFISILLILSIYPSIYLSQEEIIGIKIWCRCKSGAVKLVKLVMRCILKMHQGKGKPVQIITYVVHRKPTFHVKLMRHKFILTLIPHPILLLADVHGFIDMFC